MIVYAIVKPEGRTGKTTTAINLGRRRWARPASG